jgi:hypothetical protein
VLLRFFCGLLVALSAYAVSPRSVTVLLNYDQPYSRSSYKALERQLKTSLQEVGFQLDLRELHATAPHEEFSQVVVFRMKGNCSMNLEPQSNLLKQHGVLAMAHTSDGAVLPFGEVECDRVRQSLQHLLGGGSSPRHQIAFGTALGMVMEHEIYHMLGNATQHTKDGVTKESLSAHELLEGTLSLPRLAQQAIRNSAAIVEKTPPDPVSSNSATDDSADDR